MTINFPLSPELNDVYTFNDRTWTWNGRYWKATSTTIGYTGSQGDIGFTGSQGDIGFTGSQGDIGSIGFTGSKGNTGANGNRSVALIQEGLLVARTGIVRWYAPADLTM